MLSCVAVFSIAIVLSGPLSSQVRAADEDDDETVETKFIKGLFGINNRNSINYRERAPLVVPPNLDRLPAPEANALVNSPAWPKDPEVVEAKKRAAAKKAQRRSSPEEDRSGAYTRRAQCGRSARLAQAGLQILPDRPMRQPTAGVC